jgi:CubicO group peptidase (beta-lactamase class C family)
MEKVSLAVASFISILVVSSTTSQVSRADLQNLNQRSPQRLSPSGKVDITPRPNGVNNWELPPNLNYDAVAAQQVANAIKARFANKSVGYAVTVITKSGARAEVADGFARREPPDSNGRPMKPTERITIASVSKTITAASLLRAMTDNKVGLDAPVWQYLPSTWTYSNNFKTITIRQLLNHSSGVRNCGIDFDGLKDCAKMGISLANKVPEYNNANYAFMRIMIPRILGTTTITAEGYAASYIAWTNQQVLLPAGIDKANCKPTSSTPALSYESATSNPVNFSVVNPGEIWGDMSLVCGSQGWNLSSRDLASFMHTLTFTNKILPQQPTVDQMRAGNLGMFWGDYGNGLEGWNHRGWHPYDWGGNKGEINTLILSLNNGLTIGVVINSKYNGNYFNDIIAAVKSVKI